MRGELWMKRYFARHKRGVILICVMVVLYICIPVLERQAPPFHLFRLDADRVTRIEVAHWGNSIWIEEPSEVAKYVEKLNHTHYFFWMPVLGQSDYILTIYFTGSKKSYMLSSGELGAGLAYFADLEYFTDLFPDC